MDYYQILQVSRTATLDEIKSSYRRLAKLYHPDLNKSPNAAELFKQLTNAYDALLAGWKPAYTPPPPPPPRPARSTVDGDKIFRYLSDTNLRTNRRNFYAVDLPDPVMPTDTWIHVMLNNKEYRYMMPAGTKLPHRVHFGQQDVTIEFFSITNDPLYDKYAFN